MAEPTDGRFELTFAGEDRLPDVEMLINELVGPESPEWYMATVTGPKGKMLMYVVDLVDSYTAGPRLRDVTAKHGGYMSWHAMTGARQVPE